MASVLDKSLADREGTGTVEARRWEPAEEELRRMRTAEPMARVI